MEKWENSSILPSCIPFGDGRGGLLRFFSQGGEWGSRSLI